MTDAKQDRNGGHTGPRPKRGVPRGSLQDASELARKVWDAARRSSVEWGAFAKALGHSAPSGGAYKTKLALLRVFGLIENVGEDRVRLTDTGFDVIRGDDPGSQAAAKRKAFLNVGAYSELVSDQAGHKLIEDEALANRFHYGWGVSDDAAKEAAKSFVESAQFAGVIDADRIVRTTSAALKAASEDDQDGPSSRVADRRDREEPSPEDSEGGGTGARKTGRVDPGVDGPGDPPMITVDVSLDLSGFSTEDVIKILRTLLSLNRGNGDG